MTQIKRIEVQVPLMQTTFNLEPVYMGEWVWTLEAEHIESSTEWTKQILQEVENTTENSRLDEEYQVEALGIIVDLLSRQGLGFTTTVTYE